MAGVGTAVPPALRDHAWPSASASMGSPGHPIVQRMLDPGSFPCPSCLRAKLSPPFPGPRKGPTAASIRRSGLGVRGRNVTVNLSPNADFSPKLESRPFYSTSFFACAFSGLASFANRKVGIPFACRTPRWLLATAVDTTPTCTTSTIVRCLLTSTTRHTCDANGGALVRGVAWHRRR
jgi:hypothetical protein